MDERNKWRLIGGGEGIHWEDIDKDISIGDLEKTRERQWQNEK